MDMSLYRNVTPQGKVVAVNDELGNFDIKNQQGTTRQLYDTLPLDGTSVLKFFQNCQSRTFPDTNLNENKLQVGESMIVRRLYFSVITKDAVTALPTDVLTFEEAAIPEFYAADWSLFFDTSQKVKDSSLTSQMSKFNKFASYANNEVITLDSHIVLPPNIQWRVELRMFTYAAIADTYLRCTLEGFGTIYNPRVQN